MYLVELSSGIPVKQSEQSKQESSLSHIQRYRPIRSIEEIEADANEGDQSGLDVVLGNYRRDSELSFDFSFVFDFISYACERVRSYLKPKQSIGPPETWHE